MKILILSLIVSYNAMALYGHDDRKELYQIKDQKIKSLASVMAYQVERHYELRGWTFNRFWEILTKPLNERGICSNDKYANQPSLKNNCTGILVGPKTLLTAGNCLTEHYCKNDLYYWMFNYHLDNANSFDVKRSRKNFYLCDKVIKRVYDPNVSMSFALIELKKVVKGIKPVELSSIDELQKGDKLLTLGHFRGMPLKIDDGGKASLIEGDSFLLNSDITGTIGSGVFNARTNKLEGLVVYGPRPYVGEEGACKTELVLEDSNPYEYVIRSNVFKDFLAL